LDIHKGFAKIRNMNVKEVRRRNAQDLADSVGDHVAFRDHINRYRKRTGKDPLSQQYISAIIGKTPTKGIGHNMGNDIEAAFDKEDGWLDFPHWQNQDDTEAKLLELFRQSDERGKAAILNIAEQEALHSSV